MMRHSVHGFDHRTGSHCGSTAMRNLLWFQGHDLSEGMVIGLGAAPWFLSFEGEGLSPSRFFVGRTVAFEQDLAEVLGARLDEHMEPFDDALAHMRSLLDAGRPVYLTTDVRWLPYYETTSHFNGHRTVLAALDDDGGALLSDSHFPGLQRVDAASFKRSVTSSVPPFVKHEVMYGTLDAPALPPLAPLVRPAIRRCADAMLAGEEFDGLGGIERLVQTLPEWATLPDAAWAARFGYQVIEKRGTGGGFFRRLYAAFLQESGERFGDAVARSLVQSCITSAEAWSSFALAMREVSMQPQPRFEAAAKLAARVAVAERALWETAKERLG